jgi:guanylate kinase
VLTTKGSLYIVSAPSGTGKTSLVKALLASLSNIKVSVSYTTRSMRPGELEGVHYHFVSKEEFGRRIVEGDFIEHAEVYDNQYGTSRSWVEQQLENGIDVILEIEWQGARQVCEQFSDVIRIFILPPSLGALEQRLRARAQDEEAVIYRRLSEARKEVKLCKDYDYVIINDQFEIALSDLRSVIRAEHCRLSKQSQRFQQIIDELVTESDA